ncbi:hypothetical protein Droror1_Dr00000242 [Drosera rotundifolia]
MTEQRRRLGKKEWWRTADGRADWDGDKQRILIFERGKGMEQMSGSAGLGNQDADGGFFSWTGGGLGSDQMDGCGVEAKATAKYTIFMVRPTIPTTTTQLKAKWASKLGLTKESIGLGNGGARQARAIVEGWAKTGEWWGRRAWGWQGWG